MQRKETVLLQLMHMNGCSRVAYAVIMRVKRHNGSVCFITGSTWLMNSHNCVFTTPLADLWNVL